MTDTEHSELSTEEENTSPRQEAPVEMVLRKLLEMSQQLHDLALVVERELPALAVRVENLTLLVSRAVEGRMSDEQAVTRANMAIKRCEVLDARCRFNHPEGAAPTNGAGHG